MPEGEEAGGDEDDRGGFRRRVGVARDLAIDALIQDDGPEQALQLEAAASCRVCQGDTSLVLWGVLPMIIGKIRRAP